MAEEECHHYSSEVCSLLPKAVVPLVGGEREDTAHQNVAVGGKDVPKKQQEEEEGGHGTSYHLEEEPHQVLDKAVVGGRMEAPCCEAVVEVAYVDLGQRIPLALGESSGEVCRPDQDVTEVVVAVLMEAISPEH